MTCTTCLRDFPAAVCYACTPGAEEPRPHDAFDVAEALGEYYGWASVRYASPDWDALTDDETYVAVCVKRGWTAWPVKAFEAARALSHAETDKAAKAERDRAEREALLVGSHLGVVGGKFDFPPLLCTAVIQTGPRHTQDGRYYGEGLVVKFVCPEGNHVVWFTTEGGKLSPEIDKRYNITSQVKAHDDYNGVRQTVITRPKGEEIV